MRVLVVDDDPLTRKLHAGYLAALGCEAITAANGVEAMSLLQSHWPLDLALIDWHMSPLNGYAFASAIRADPDFAELHLVMVTAEERPERIEQALRIGVDSVLPKPLDREVLERSLEVVENASRAAPRVLEPTPVEPEPVLPRSLGEIASAVARDLDCRLGPVLGRGGMAEVFRLERQGREPLALKISLERLDPRGVPAQRFQREAEILQRLRHPNLVRVEAHDQVDGFCYMVMELLERDLLSAIDEAGGRLPSDRARAVIGGCAAALEAVHAAGIVHRDLKPANILLRADGTPALSDLGLATFLSMIGRMTSSGKVIGTPAYLPPEAVLGKVADPLAVDIYGLGASWFHCLAGRPPFEGASVWETFQLIVHHATPDVASEIPDLPAADRELLLRCLAKDPAQRPAGAGALARALAAD